ncbi:hypothetical protein BaRGS_00004661 [Batillaria attramentaria]|uniref:Uncharacterized protein n=1 Tax=Batillaria attramentaria TaxID=370345 RepID=A0ABD0LWC8_9CAEN
MFELLYPTVQIWIFADSQASVNETHSHVTHNSSKWLCTRHDRQSPSSPRLPPLNLASVGVASLNRRRCRVGKNEYDIEKCRQQADRLSLTLCLSGTIGGQYNFGHETRRRELSVAERKTSPLYRLDELWDAWGSNRALWHGKTQRMKFFCGVMSD